jgi:putative transposase
MTPECGASAGERDLEGRVRLFHSGARPDPATVTRYIEERRETFGVEPICSAIGVPVSTHYARRSRKPSARELADQQLLAEIEAARSGRRRVYGARKTWKELRRRDVDVGRDHVARVMREHGLAGKLRGSKKRTTIPDVAAAERARDLLQRDFTATRPNEKWVADLTYIRTWNGFVYLAFILDCYSRRIVGWQLATHMRAELVLDALEMANGLRRPDPGLIAHSDRGSQYTSLTYTDRLDELEIAPSVGSRGDAYDKAMAEAWVATFKNELVDGRRFPSVEHVEHEVLEWIGFYNDERLHEALGDLPPAEYEESNIKKDNTPMVAAT